MPRLLCNRRDDGYALLMPMQMTPLAVTAYTATSALGRGLDSQRDALAHGRSGLRPNDISSAPLACWIGRVEGVEAVELPPDLIHWDCRNNRLAWLGLQQDGFIEQVRAARRRLGSRRIALFLFSFITGTAATEKCYRRLDCAGQL